MEKRGLSEVVTTVLMVLLALGAILLVWFLVRNVIMKAGNEIDISKLTVQTSIVGSKVYVNEPQEKISLVVKREAGAGEVVGFNVIIEDESGQSVVKRADVSIGELESRTVNVNYTESGLGKIAKVSVAPIVKSGTTGEEKALDVSAYYIIGTASNIGHALSFDGINDAVEISGIVLQNDVSISLWTKVDATNCNSAPAGTGSSVAISGGASIENGFYMSGTGCNTFGVKGASSTNNKFLGTFTLSSLNTKEWNHYVYVSSVTKGYFYINGVLVRTSEDIADTVRATNPYTPFYEIDGLMDIGHARGDTLNDRYFQGEIDDVRIYNKALDAGEVADLYNGDYSGGVAKDNLFRWYKFDEGSGEVAKDSSGNGNNGAIVGASWV